MPLPPSPRGYPAWARAYAGPSVDAAEEEKYAERAPSPRALRTEQVEEVNNEKQRRVQSYEPVYGVPFAPAGMMPVAPLDPALGAFVEPHPPFMHQLSPRAMSMPPPGFAVLPRAFEGGLSPPRRVPTDPERGPDASTWRRAEEAERRWLAEEERVRAGAWRQEEMLRVGEEERQRRIVRSAMVSEPFNSRAAEQEDEARMMARWARMVQSTVDSTERALGAATAVAADAGRNMRQREATAEREKELAHEYLVREVETTKALAAQEREKAFQGRSNTTREEQATAEDLAEQRMHFETDMLAREARHREMEAERRDNQEHWRLRRKEREDITREEERIERAQKEEGAATAAARRAQDLRRVIVELDAAQRAREEQLARREAEREEQRRYCQRREAELDAARREEAELADNMISNLDRRYKEQEQTAVALQVAEAARVDRSAILQESRTRAPFRADRAEEHLKIKEAYDEEQLEELERDACALRLTEGDAERRYRAAYRLHRELDGQVDLHQGDDRSLRSTSYEYGNAQTGGPEPNGMIGAQAQVHRNKLTSEHSDAYDAKREAVFESTELRDRYAGAAYTFDDEASQTRPRPALAHIHNCEEYDFAQAAVAAGGPVPQDRHLCVRGIPQGRLFAGVRTPRQEMEEAREAKHTLMQEEERCTLEAARAKREEADYTYAACNLHFQQLKARYEQYMGEATPALTAAQTAAASLTVEELEAVLQDPSPPPVIQAVCVAACTLLTGQCGGNYAMAAGLMSPAPRFLDLLRSFRSNSVGSAQIDDVHHTMRTLDVDEVLSISSAAASMLMWTANMTRYNQVYRSAWPVHEQMNEAAQNIEKADEARRAAAKRVSFLLVHERK